MLVEMQTGQPLYPGTDDTDQLWLILKSCSEEQLLDLRGSAILQAKPYLTAQRHLTIKPERQLPLECAQMQKSPPPQSLFSHSVKEMF